MTGVYLSKCPSVKQNAIMLLAVFAMTMSCLAQSSPKEKNDSVFVLVKRYLNEKAEDSLYSLTGENFRKHIKRDVFSNITEKNLFPLGPIKVDSFVKISGK